VKCLVINSDTVGEGLAFALRCVKAGHQVRLYLAPGNNPTTGDGFKGVEKVSNWIGSMGWADLTFATGNHQFLARLNAFKARGKAVYAPSVEAAKLEIDRGKGMEFFKSCGIEVPEYTEFKTLKDAEQHVWENEERYVFKTMGDEEDKSLSYCSKSPADMIARLQRWQKLNMNPKGPVMLQEFIEGTELGVSQWMGTEGFIGLPNENWEHKKLLSGNCGPNSGEAGTVLKYVSESKLANEVLYPLEDKLIEMGCLGDVDVNCMIDESGQAWPLEFTVRPGWPAFNIQMIEHRGDPIEWMRVACAGDDAMDCGLDHCCGVVLAQPDYPYSKLTKAETDGIPIYGVTPQNQRYIHPQSVKVEKLPVMNGAGVTEGENWSSAGDYLAVVTGTGKSVSQACERAYKTVKEVTVADLMYRDDVGEGLKDDIPKVQKHGFALEFKY
jgi:phosphoribosylamine---glycine ligase